MSARKRAKAQGDPALAVAYLRASKDDQKLTADGQRASLERWASARGVRIVAWHEDHGVCSVTPIDKRPGMLSALADVRTFGAGVFCVAKRDRLARDPMISAAIEHMAASAGAQVLSAAGEGEGNDPTSKMMRGIIDLFAEFERAQIIARTTAALAVKRARGERTGSVPIGMRVDAADARRSKKTDAPCALVVDEREAQAIAVVRAEIAKGTSLRACAKTLNALGLLPRTGKVWHPQQIARMAA